MYQTSVPPSSKTYKTEYNKFAGVDFRTDPTQVDSKRSPWAPNLISDSGGKPEKRLGWRTVMQMDAEDAFGLHALITADGTHLLAHFGNKLFRWDDEVSELFDGMNEHRSMAMSFRDALWIADGKTFLKYDGEAVSPASEDAYIPTTVISRNPSGGGQTYDAINMLSPARINSFLSDGTSKAYQLDASNLDDDEVIVMVGLDIKTEGTDFSVNRETGVVTFTTAPVAPVVTGQDNVYITFYKTVEGYADRVNKCQIMTIYGSGNDNRVFLAGNPDFPNYDFYCGFGDPSYFPDLNYSIIGTDRTRIMGYRKIYSSLAIVKEDNAQDYTIFIRTPDIFNGQTVFRVLEGIVGVGAISPYAFCNLLDDPLFLSRTGMYAIASEDIRLERTIIRRSSFVDPLLTKEENLSDAFAVEWRDYMILSINDRCYVADVRQKNYPRNNTFTFEYEWYYWTNIPGKVWLEQGGELYFSTDDGRICKFNTDILDERDKSILMTAYSDDGEAIVAEWTTKADDDEDFMQYKTMIKKGCGVMIKPYARSSAKIYLRTERDFGRLARYEQVDIFDFADIDFTRFSFNTLDTPQIISIKTKVKKYKTLTIRVVNDAVNEAFGIFGIIKRFTRNNLVK